jgi:hypothetical protein
VARLLMTAGAVLFLAGAAAELAAKFGIRLGRLPGDIVWEGKNVKVFFPVVTMILVSVALTLILNLIARFVKK